MREVKLSNGKALTVNSLTGAQVLESRTSKLDAIDEAFSIAEINGIPKEEAKKMAFSDLRAIQKAVVAETFGLEEEVKN